MSTLASYTFLPWLREGVANTITSQDGDSSVKTRASVGVSVQLSGDPVGGGSELTDTITQQVQLYGPGDVVGIDSRAVVKTEPLDWITNFENNYMPAIDFYDADFPWRYTPAAPDASGLKLRPWITLIVLADSEYDAGQSTGQGPLPFINLHDASALPPADELWAWAHVHVNDSLAASAAQLVSTDVATVVSEFEAALKANPDVAYSRLLCARRLAAETGYHAFVIPTFEAGRLAGLGLDPTGAPDATSSAWSDYSGRPQPTQHPYYYSWYFRTGSTGDFEYLVRQLTPRPVDARVGTRDLDVQDPGSNIPAIPGPGDSGVLRLGGALQVPDQDLTADELAQRNAYADWDQPYPQPFETALAAFIDLPDTYSVQDSSTANAGAGLTADPDPLITSPLYGRWPSLTQRLLTNQDGTPAPNPTNWVHRLNLDPGFRVPAAFGTAVVQANVEPYMNDAWQQIGDVLAANQLIRRLHLSIAVSTRWYDVHLKPLAAVSAERAFLITSPLTSRVMASPTTIAHQQSLSRVQGALTSPAMRRVLRPGGRLMRSLPFDATVTADNLLSRVNAGTVSAAPPKQPPQDAPTVDGFATAAETAAQSAPTGLPGWVTTLLNTPGCGPQTLLVIAALIVIEIILSLPLRRALKLAASFGAAVLVVYQWLKQAQTTGQSAAALTETGQTPASVAELPDSPNFQIVLPVSATPAPTIGTTDSATATRFKAALTDSYTLLQASREVAPDFEPQTLALPQLTDKLIAGCEPVTVIPRRALSYIAIPAWIAGQLTESFGEVMAYPKIDLPMYEPLKERSIELLLPNINLISENSITLVETNQKFIESYMVGLNHEFARTLLWREYPTDQRGSYFRQFWDVRSYIDSEGLSGDPLKEKLYDIPQLHTWPLTSALGTHNNREATGQTGEQAVLVIRGELLKKYPTAVIYAQRAAWVMKDGQIDTSQPRTLVDNDDPPMTDPSVVRSPLYEAKADPDIYFFGFDLTIAQAKGDSGQHPGDDPGWFFVIRERPGEPRFGLELDAGTLEVFDDLTWDDAQPGGQPGDFLDSGSLAHVTLSTADPQMATQRAEDLEVDSAAVSAARWAYLLYRAPIMVAVHADQMLS